MGNLTRSGEGDSAAGVPPLGLLDTLPRAVATLRYTT